MTREQAIQICQELETTEIGLVKLCKKHGVGTEAFYKWIDASEENEKRYARAREAQADYMVEKMLEISDKDKDDEKPFVGINHIHRARLQVDTRKWIASKLRPKKYGDKLDIEATVKQEQPLFPDVKEKDLFPDVPKNDSYKQDTGPK